MSKFNVVCRFPNEDELNTKRFSLDKIAEIVDMNDWSGAPGFHKLIVTWHDGSKREVIMTNVMRFRFLGKWRGYHTKASSVLQDTRVKTAYLDDFFPKPRQLTGTWRAYTREPNPTKENKEKAVMTYRDAHHVHESMGGRDVGGFWYADADNVDSPPWYVSFSFGKAYLERHRDIPEVRYTIAVVWRGVKKSPWVGFSYCAPEEIGFDYPRGMSIALTRAMEQSHLTKTSMARLRKAFRNWLGINKEDKNA